MANKTAALCANPDCNAELHEGRSALYDDYGDRHFCRQACYGEWWDANVEAQKEEYRLLNVNECDL